MARVRGQIYQPAALDVRGGDSCTAAISVAAGAWRLEFWARVDGVEVYVGTAHANAVGLLDRQARAVASATCPGASRWRIDVYGPEGESAEVLTAASPFPVGKPGLQYFEEPAP